MGECTIEPVVLTLRVPAAFEVGEGELIQASDVNGEKPPTEFEVLQVRPVDETTNTKLVVVQEVVRLEPLAAV